MRILIHTVGGSGFVMAQRLQNEGHEVSVLLADEDNMFIANKKDPTYDGLVHKWSSLNQALQHGQDLVVFDTAGEHKDKVAAVCNKAGVPTLGGSKFGTEVEMDRTLSTEIMKKAGIQYPDTYSFKTFQEGINFIKKHPDRYVFKPNDNQTNYASYVSKTPEDMINTMEHYHDEHLIDETKGYILQKFVKGFEISSELWFNGEEFLPFCVHDVEEKKFLVGNLGPTTGCMGSLVWINDNYDDMLVQNVLKMGPILKQYGYTGPVDVNTIVDKNKQPYALEYCLRFGYVCIENTMELCESDFGELLYATATGKPYTPKFSKDFCIGIRLTIPPYPMTEIPEKTSDADKKIVTEFLENRSVGIRIIGFEDFADSCYWDGVRLDEEREGLFSCNDILGSICGKGKTIDEAKALVYDRLSKMDIPDKQYRTDIGDRGKEWFKLQGNKPEKQDSNTEDDAQDYDEGYISQLLIDAEDKVLSRYRGE